MDNNIIVAAQNIGKNIYALISFVIGDLIQLIGIVIFLAGLMALIRNKNMGMRNEGITGEDIKRSVWAMIAGSFIYALPEFVEVLNNSFGMNGAAARAALFGSSQIDTSSISGAIVSAVKMVMILVGIIAMIKGALLLNDWGNGKDVPMSAVLSFIIGGAILVNFYEFVHAIANSIATPSLVSIVNALLKDF